MWIWFDIQCDRQTQRKVADEIRSHVLRWKQQDIVNQYVITHHSRNSATDSLYVCLEFLSINEPDGEPISRDIELSEDLAKFIPNEILEKLVQLRDKFTCKIATKDYRAAVSRDRSVNPDKEIQYVAVGTDIASEFLRREGSRDMLWYTNNAQEVLRFVNVRFKEKEGLNHIFHFFCNSLGMSIQQEDVIRRIIRLPW